VPQEYHCDAIPAAIDCQLSAKPILKDFAKLFSKKRPFCLKMRFI